jgi:hypothetical protein
MIVVVCGDRDWEDYRMIYERLKLLPNDTIIVQGEARGADKLAKEAAYKLNLGCACVPAYWGAYKKAAGPIRNAWMLALKPDLVIAFHDRIHDSKGTKHMLDISKSDGVDTELLTHKGGSNGV